MPDKTEDIFSTAPGNSDPRPDFTSNELEEYILTEFYIPPKQPGDMNAHEIATLLDISQQHVRKTLEPAIASGKIIFIKAAREEDGRVNPVWRMGKS